MTSSHISWYSLNRDLSVVERGAVTKAGAMKIIDDYFAKLGPRYGSADEAVAETMFGFQKSAVEFVEICLNGGADISFKYETSILRRILFWQFSKTFQKKRTLASKAEVRAEVGAFYDLESAAFRRHVVRA
jgi:hypothetical protein